MLYSTEEAANTAGYEYLDAWGLQRWNPCLQTQTVTVLDTFYFVWRLSIPQNYLTLHLCCTTDGEHQTYVTDRSREPLGGSSVVNPREAIRELVQNLKSDLEYQLEVLNHFEQRFAEDDSLGVEAKEVVEGTTTTPMWELLRDD